MSQAVHDMFQNIASRYDVANDVLSFGVHRQWRQVLFRSLGDISGARVVDLCSGTGDVAFGLAKRVGPHGKVVGLDFVRNMVAIAARKQRTLRSALPLRFIHGDALHLPLRDACVDIATVSFGIRNVDDPRACLREMRRVLTPGGRAAVLEFGQPTVPVFSSLYRFYSSSILPRIGGLVSGNRDAYEYLERTSAHFPAGEKFAAMMRESGFSTVTTRPLFGGVAYLYIGSV